MLLGAKSRRSIKGKDLFSKSTPVHIVINYFAWLPTIWRPPVLISRLGWRSGVMADGEKRHMLRGPELDLK